MVDLGGSGSLNGLVALKFCFFIGKKKLLEIVTVTTSEISLCTTRFVSCLRDCKLPLVGLFLVPVIRSYQKLD